MNDRLSALRLFARVAHLGGFSRAARESGLSQPSASRMISDLERDIGVALFTRTTRAVTLTEAGADYLARIEPILAALEEARSNNIALDITTLEYTLRLTIERLFDRFAREPHDVARIERLGAVIEMARSLPFEVDLWTAQNVWSEISRSVSGEFSQREQAGDQEARNWLEHFHLLGEKLQVRIAVRLQALSQTG